MDREEGEKEHKRNRKGRETRNERENMREGG